MAVVREVVDEEARRVVGEPHDPATRRDRRRYHAQDGLTLCAEGPHGLCPSDAQSVQLARDVGRGIGADEVAQTAVVRSEEHTSELQSRQYLVCRLLLEKKKLQAYIARLT